ncbi:MAG: cyanophycinase, partial [Bacteroidota bacterium]
KKNDKLILKRVVELNHAKTAVIIPTASNYPEGLARDYFYVFKELGIENSHILDIRERSDCDRPEFLEKIELADLIFFTGGDQFRLVSTIIDTTLFEKIKEKNLKGATIAGTSAGAAAACDPILFDGDYSGLQKGTTNYFRGFGFIKNITIDTHFVNRGRLGRLTQFLSSGHSKKGIGIGENTAIIISPEDTFEVVGSEMVTLVNTENISFSNYDKIQEKDPIVINDIRIGFLQHGSTFDLKEWKVLSSNGTHQSSPEKVRIYN